MILPIVGVLGDGIALESGTSGTLDPHPENSSGVGAPPDVDTEPRLVRMEK